MLHVRVKEDKEHGATREVNQAAFITTYVYSLFRIMHSPIAWNAAGRVEG